MLQMCLRWGPKQIAGGAAAPALSELLTTATGGSSWPCWKEPTAGRQLREVTSWEAHIGQIQRSGHPVQRDAHLGELPKLLWGFQTAGSKVRAKQYAVCRASASGRCQRAHYRMLVRSGTHLTEDYRRITAIGTL